MKKILRKCLSSAVVAVLVVAMMLPNLTAFAITIGASKTPAQLAETLLSEGVNAIEGSESVIGNVRYFTDGDKFGTADLGIKEGVILSTAWSEFGNQYESECDPDLKKLIENEELEDLIDDELYYGADLACLQFTMKATGNLLNFNYIFMSGEFTESPKYNDVFGLFVSVNGGPFENIAKLPNGEDVSITNLRAGHDGQQLNGGLDSIGSLCEITGQRSGERDYFTYNIDGFATDEWWAERHDTADEEYYTELAETNGYSIVLNAKKEVKKNDIVTVKLVIADVSDDLVTSAVLIQADSMSFDAPGAKVDYVKEVITGLDAATYTITEAGNTYNFTVAEGADIPLVGKDDNNKVYNFEGKEISIKQHMEGGVLSDPKVIQVAARPVAPSKVLKENISLGEEGIKFGNCVSGQEYIFVPVGTTVTEAVWGNAKLANGSTVSFVTDSLGNEFDITKSYVAYTRVAVSSTGFCSASSEASAALAIASILPHECEMTWVIDKLATATEKGSMTGTCIYCGKTTTKEIPVTAGENGSGDVTVESADENAYTGKLSDESDVANKVTLTNTEQQAILNGDELVITLTVEDVKETVKAEDKTAIESKLEDKKLGTYLDINLLKQVGSNEPEKIRELKGKIKIAFVVPETLRGEAGKRTYTILRLHDDVVDTIVPVYDEETHTLTFETDRFSTYALAYEDTSVAAPPATGDATSVVPFIMLLGVGFVLVTFATKRREML